MISTTLAKHYDQLTPAERLTLALEAMGRDDDADVKRLVLSCPKRVYRQYDDAYIGRLDASQICALAVSLELKPLVRMTQTLRALADAAPEWMEPAGRLLMMAFDQGHYAGWLAARPAPANPPETAEPAEAEPVEAEDDPATQAAAKQVERIGRILGKGTHRRFQKAAEECAGELATKWEGFGQFCRAELRIEPETLLRAWRISPDDLIEVLAAYPNAKPDGKAAADLAAMFAKGWERRTEAAELG